MKLSLDLACAARAAWLQTQALEDAITEVARAGGGKVVVEHPQDDPFKVTFFLIKKGQREPKLPAQRLEYIVPAFFEG